MSNLTDIIERYSITDHRTLWALIDSETVESLGINIGESFLTGSYNYGTGVGQLKHSQGAFWDIYNDPKVRMAISPLAIKPIEAAELYELLEYYDEHADRLRVAAVRRITKPHYDDKFVTAVTKELEANLGNPEKEVLVRDSALDAWQAGYAGEVIKRSDLPQARRLKGALDAFDQYKVQRSRLVLQNVLSDLSLGKINGIGLDDLDQINSADFAKVLGSAVDAYPNCTAAGALWYIIKKGTDKDEYLHWYNSRTAVHRQDLAFLETLIELHRQAGMPAPGASCVGIFDGALSTLSYLDTLTEKLPADSVRLAAMAMPEAVLDEAFKYASTNDQAKFSTLAEKPAPLQSELFLALLAGYAHGADAADADILAIWARLSKPFRMLAVRTPGAMNKANRTLLAVSK